jgi:hypothetical protein
MAHPLLNNEVNKGEGFVATTVVSQGSTPIINNEYPPGEAIC